MKFKIAQVRESTADPKQWWVCAEFDGTETKFAFVSKAENPHKDALVGRMVEIVSGKNAVVVDEPTAATAITEVHKFAADTNRRILARKILNAVQESLKHLEDLL